MGYLTAVSVEAIDAVVEGSQFVDEPGPVFMIRSNSSEVCSDTTVSPTLSESWFGGDRVFWAP